MNPQRHYLGYGVLISSDIELRPYLHEADHGRCRISLEREEDAGDDAPFSREAWLFQAHGRLVRVLSDRPLDADRPGDRVHFDIGGMLSFSWRAGANAIKYRLADPSAVELVPFWLLHIVLPFYLANERVYEFLHAAAVEVDENAVLFVAPSHGGKSTMANYFVSRGHRLISDDKLAAYEEDGQFRVVPAHGFMRPYRAFEVLGQPAAAVAEGSKPIFAIFNLARVAANDPVDVQPIHGVESFRELMANYLYRLNAHAAHHMQCLTRLLNATPTYKVKVPGDLGRLGDVYKAILEQLQGSKPPNRGQAEGGTGFRNLGSDPGL